MGMRPAWHYSSIQRRPLQATACAVHQTMTQAYHSDRVDGCGQGQRAVFYQIKFDLAEAKRHRGGRCLEDLAQDANKQGKKPPGDVDPCPYNPMQLGAAKMQRMSEEHTKLLAAGKCFGCKNTGHRYRNCPERPVCQGKNRQGKSKLLPKPRVRAADTSAPIDET